MRIRSIKPDYFQDEDLADLGPYARILYLGLKSLADRRGRVEDRPRRIQVAVLPYDRDVDVDRLLNDLVRVGRVVRYDVGGQRLIWLPKFENEERIGGKEAQSESLLPEYVPTTTLRTGGKHQGSAGEAPRKQEWRAFG